MAKRRALSSKEADALKADGTHWLADGLYLQVRADRGTRSYLARYFKAGRNHWHGLGSVRDVSLAEARDLATDVRRAVRRDGAHPVAERRAAKAATVIATRSVLTFDQCAEKYIESHRAGWKNDKHIAQWESTLRMYASPVVGKRGVDQVTVEDVLKILQPIWTAKPETASRLRGRIEKVLGWAEAMKYRPGPNPAAWKGGALSHLLPAISKVQKVEHHGATPYAEVPALVAELRARGTSSAKALLFTVLTAARTGETTGGVGTEIDGDGALWVVPAERMKAGRQHSVPLSTQALALVATKAGKANPLFTGLRLTSGLSNMAMLEMLRGIRGKGETVHGLRSAFSTWAREQTDYPREIVEACLAHASGDAVELAYRRTTFVEKRRELMQRWADYCWGEMQ